MTKIEKRGGRYGVETRASDTGQKTLVGYAAVFNTDTEIGDYFVERIDPAAFNNTLGNDVRALVNHDTGRVIGRTKSGTLRLAVDSKGLKIEIDVPDTADGRDLVTLVERGDISGMSFGFVVTKQAWDETGDVPVRTIQEVELYEVSACAFPAYEDTEIAVRSLQTLRDARSNDFEAARTAAEQENAARELAATKRAEEAAARRRGYSIRKAETAQRIRGIRQEAP